MQKINAKGAAPVAIADAAAGIVWANQAWRRARRIAIKDGHALVQYVMPAGDAVYIEVPAAATWEQISADGFGRIRRNVSWRNPPARWRAEIQAIEGVH